MFFYNLAIRFYYLGIFIASSFNSKAKKWLRGRKNIFERLEKDLKNRKNVIWIHCASLGEFEQGRPVIEKIKKQNPQQKILLTFFSPSGYEIRRNYNQADWVYYLPLDTRKNATRFLSIVKPQCIIFVKYEFWLNYLSIIKQQQIPAILISAIFRENQHFFKWYGQIFRNALNTYNYIFVQEKNSLKLLNQIGVQNCNIAGDTRFDRVFDQSSNIQRYENIESFLQNKKTIVCGSTWPADETELLNAISKLDFQNLKIIIVPHNIEENNINQLVSIIKSENKSISFTKITDTKIDNDANILIVNQIGLLSSLYQYATVSFIGGGFGKGIHNILEAATFGTPILFGPNYTKFNEAKELIELKAAVSITNSNNLLLELKRLIENEELQKQKSIISKNYVETNIGATDKIISYISENKLFLTS